MKNVFIDFEFGKKVFNHRTKNKVVKYKALDIISIGVHSEDFDYYAVSNEFDIKANMNHPWMRENVLSHIFNEFRHLVKGEFDQKSMTEIIALIGKSKKEIADELYNIINPSFKNFSKSGITDILIDSDLIKDKYKQLNELNNPDYKPNKIKFYGWHCESDWMCICELYSDMGSLPIGYNYDMADLKQTQNEICEDFKGKLEPYIILDAIKQHPKYPKNESLHHPLADAKWTSDMFDFLTLIKKRCLMKY